MKRKKKWPKHKGYRCLTCGMGFNAKHKRKYCKPEHTPSAMNRKQRYRDNQNGRVSKEERSKVRREILLTKYPEIRKLAKSGKPQAPVAKTYGVSREYVGQILRRTGLHSDWKAANKIWKRETF